MTYVIFHDDPDSAEEIYVHAIQNPLSTIVEITDNPASALRFDNAADAYGYGKAHCLDWWKVGKR